MIWFVGAGSGAVDLITVRGQRLLSEADVIVYAGSLVNPELLGLAKSGAVCLDSAAMTLEQVVEAMVAAEKQSKTVVRLHSGDPSLYGAIREQMDRLAALKIPFDVVPGVSSFCAAAASLKAEYTLPGVSQSVIITRMAGRTPVPEAEEISRLAAHGSSMAIFLSSGMLEQLQERLLLGAYTLESPAAIVYKASWPDEKVFRCTVGTLAQTAAKEGITRTALVLVGNFLGAEYERSRLYAPDFSTGYRDATDAN